MISFLRNRKRSITFCVATAYVLNVFTPGVSYALTSGPTQPEVQGFQPAGTSDMVDLFSGDFSYNIPLLELPGPNGGYPFNLAYQSGVTMDQEASWVGLGWSLNPGTINRQMRGLPDEFKGDVIRTKMSVAPSVTVGLAGGASIEFLGADKKGGLDISLSISQNNYKGVGYSIGAQIGYDKATQGLAGSGVGLGLTLDSKEGVNVTPSLSLGTKLGDFGLSVGYNSKTGMSSMSFSHEVQFQENKNATRTYNQNHKKQATVYSGSMKQTSTLTLAHPGYTPQITMPMRGTNIAITIKGGAGGWGVFTSPYITGFYNEQWLKHDKKWLGAGAFGYLHYQDATGDVAMLDFNREKEGIVSRESPNLPIPSLSYDIYSVTGQGIGAMYRPMRSDYGVVHDQEIESASTGGAAGVDVGGPGHFGANLSLNHSLSVSGLWKDDNDMNGAMSFQKDTINSSYEPWYFKAHGEPSVESRSTLDSLWGDKAVRVAIAGGNSDTRLTSAIQVHREDGTWAQQEVPRSAKVNHNRQARNQVIQPITNAQLLRNGEEMLPEFKVSYINNENREVAYDRKNLPAHHTTGFTALTPDGLRYVYGIPAYNLKQEEITFTARRPADSLYRASVGASGDEGEPTYGYEGTEKYLKHVEMPKYAHSYLLTAIVGPDYVDVHNDGVTPDDLGYWVKFTYRQTTGKDDTYRWRDPYSRAHFVEGWKTDPRDDKGSFTYGEKELWYLERAETKSHILQFSTVDREDGFGVAHKYDSLTDSDRNVRKSMQALKTMTLYSRFAGPAHPIKTVKFDYDYSRCQGVENNKHNNSKNRNGGKLTLTQVHFEYGNSTRGSLNPYIFNYSESNPRYDIHAYDRWGNYKPYDKGDYYQNHDFPYVDQDPRKKSSLDQYAAAWTLTKIQLPSGGLVMVDYEIDDYGYVQHKPAMQMMELVDPYASSDQAEASEKTFYTLSEDTRVRFKLEKPIPGNAVVDAKTEVLKYIDQSHVDNGRAQVFFKIKINLRGQGEGFYEYVSGYADIDLKGDMKLEKDKDGQYAYGSFALAKDQSYHPFTLRAWQHVRTNQPELANSGRNLKQTDDTGDRISQIRSLGNVIDQVRQMFGGYYKFCNGQKWGREVVLGKSWIRLNSPDKIKYGGGVRVRQVTMKDQWASNEEAVYGQVYEYTTEENGAVISSGVAAYEPLVGAEENPLRYAKKYTQSIPLRSDNNMYFEYPINETYYPGPQVGYSKVTVTSLAAASLAGKEVKNIMLKDGKNLFPTGAGVSYGTTGMTIHEFYTAKDFPVMTDETDKDNNPYRLPLLIPFVGSISINKLAASQGYSIVTNDMHGKQKKVSNYKQSKNGDFDKDAISWVQYNYACKPVSYDQTSVFALQNDFKKNNDGTFSMIGDKDDRRGLNAYTIGQETEFFGDMRQYEDNTWSGGTRFNADMFFLFIGAFVIPVPWPSISKTTSQLRTSVTNKVIFKSGILTSTEAYDGGSNVKTSNTKWSNTGAVVLTEVNNNFDDPIYSYTIPAHTQYQGMGAAYQNIGLKFSMQGVQQDVYEKTRYTFKPDAPPDRFMPGDEILLYAASGSWSQPIARVVYAGDESDQMILYSGEALTETTYRGIIVRSGYRNQLTVQAGSITALEDPSQQGEVKHYYKKAQVPR